MLIFHGFENVSGSSIVASNIIVSGLRGVKRSTTWSLLLWKSPARSNHESSLSPVTSTTRVSPSQCPFDQPIQLSTGAFVALSMLIVRTALAYSYEIKIVFGD